MKNIFNILVDIKEARSINQPLVTQNDSVVFILEVMENGVPFDLSGADTVSLANTRRDNTVVLTQGSKVNNIATFELNSSETAVTGSVVAKAQFYDPTGRVSTLSFSYQVGADPTGAGYIPSVSESTLIETVLNDGPLRIQEAIDAGDYANEQGDYALQVATDNETRYLDAVESVALRDSTYPTPGHGDTVRVTDISTSYRYVLGTGWVVTDVYNPTAIDEVASQLAETAELAVSTVSHNVDNGTIFSIIDDDGNKKVMSILKPIFEAENVPCTVAINTGRLSNSLSLNPEDLKILSDMGWTVCSHAETHLDLSELTESELEYEIKTAKDKLDSLGYDGNILVYPFGGKSAMSIKVTRKHSILGVGGYNHYNQMPIDTYALARFADISSNVFNLEACKLIVDNAPVNSWIIFYTHVANTQWETPESQLKLTQLIQYVKSKNIDIVNIKEGLKRKGNILDAGTEQNERFKVGRNGSVEMVNFVDTTINASTPVTYFPMGLSEVFINSTDIIGKGFPISSASIIRTHRIRSLDNVSNVSEYQEVTPYTTNDTYRRRWIPTTSSWTIFEKVQQNMESYPMHRVNATKNVYGASTPIVNFPNNMITTTYFDSGNNAGMPVTAGIFTTYKVGANGWYRQEVRGYLDDSIWTRKTYTDGTFGSFAEFSSKATAWAGSLDMNGGFKSLGKTKVSNFLYIEKIHSIGPTQPTLIKDVWLASEISIDSLTPTTIATIGAINILAYKDVDGLLYVKHGSSGANYTTFFKTSFS